jgi:hypothetical protein
MKLFSMSQNGHCDTEIEILFNCLKRQDYLTIFLKLWILKIVKNV